MLPSKTLAARSEKSASGMKKDRASGMKKQKDRASGMKKQKDRVTLMSCANATGLNKLPLLFIGKSKNPRCFKNITRVRYQSIITTRKVHGWTRDFF